MDREFLRTRQSHEPRFMVDGRDILNDYAKFNGLIGKDAYTSANKKTMLDILN